MQSDWLKKYFAQTLNRSWVNTEIEDLTAFDYFFIWFKDKDEYEQWAESNKMPQELHEDYEFWKVAHNIEFNQYFYEIPESTDVFSKPF